MTKNLLYYTILILTLILTLVSFVAPTQATVPTKLHPTQKNILIIMDYSPVVPWSEKTLGGVVSTIRNQALPYNVFVEYLSPYMNSASSEVDIEYIQEFLQNKYQDIVIDAILVESIVTLEIAQQLTLTAKSGIPIPLFSFELYDFRNTQYLATTRSLQVTLLQETLQAAILQNPAVDTFYIIDSFDPIFDVYFKFVAQIVTEQLSSQVRLLSFSSIQDLQEQVAALPKNAVIAYIPVFFNEDNVNYMPNQLMRLISDTASVPIYSFWETMSDHGATGGKMLSPDLIGKTAVSLFEYHFEHGEFPRLDNYQIARWYFDYDKLAQFELGVPYNANNVTFINPPRSIVNDYPMQIASITIAFILTLLFVFVFRYKQLNNAFASAKEAKANADKHIKQIEHLSEAKSAFLANVSHEIRTPINGIIGAIPLIKKSPLDAEQNKLLDIINYCSDNLLNTVNDILDHSKLENHSFTLHTDVFHCESFIQNSVNYANLINKNNSVSIVSSIECDEALFAVGDKNRLEQVINNLINNAVKFTVNGQIEIGCSITESTPSINANEKSLEFVFWVADTGVGMSEDNLEQLFTPFNQFSTTDNDKPEGTGLGLSICKQLIELMGGQIKVFSTQNVGTKVMCSLQLPWSTPNYHEDEQRNVVPFSAPKLTILVVEDNEINQMIIEKQLLDQGHTVHICDNGQACIEFLQTHPQIIELILMDLKMPVMSGEQAAQIIRDGFTGSYYQTVPIIAISAHLDVDERLGKAVHIFDAYLTKPVAVEVLKKEIHQTVVEHHSEQKQKNRH